MRSRFSASLRGKLLAVILVTTLVPWLSRGAQ